MRRAKIVLQERRGRGRGSRVGVAAGAAGALLALAAVSAGGSGSGPAGAASAWLDLRPGAALETSYAASEPRLLGLLDAAEPRALAADDFDEDGVRDLVVGLAAGDEGLIALHRGNPDAVYPHSEPASSRRAEGAFSDAPFDSPARVFALPAPADFVGAGDFDNDGHRDVAAAALGGRAVHVLPGDGRGGLGAPRRLELPGRLSAAAVGEVNRRDGIADLAVAVDGADGPRLLVFESPLGALAAEPEVFPLPAAATALVFARFDADAVLDLAAVAGTELVIVHGRDRRLSLDEAHRVRVPAARVSRFDLPFAIADLAAGDFLYDTEHRPEPALLADGGGVWIVPRAIVAGGDASAGVPRVLAAGDLVAVHAAGAPATGARLLAAKASVRAADDLVVIDPAGGALRVLSSAPDPLAVARGEAAPGAGVVNPAVALEPAAAPVAALPLRLSPDPLGDLVLLTEHGPDPVVVFADWPAQGGVTATVNLATTQLDANPGDGVCDVDLATPGLQCTLAAAIQEVELATAASTISFDSAGTYRHFGTTPATGFPVPVTLSGAGAGGPVEIWGGNLSFRGGSSLVSDLVIAGGDVGFLNLGGNLVEGNLVGTDVSGTSASPFGPSRLSTTNATTTIGGPSPAARNVVSGRGIGSFSTGDVIQGNYIGTDATGLAAIGNGFNNAALDVGNPSSVVGGTAAGAGNVVAGNQREGVILRGSGILFQGNFVGVGADGTTPLGNGRIGLNVGNFPLPDMVTIGGTAPGARNVISNNGFDVNSSLGVDLNTTNALVQGNHIGTDATGTAPMGNNLGGIELSGTGNAIGGAVAGAGNVIADSRSTLFTRGHGVFLIGLQAAAPTSGTVVQGNRIGVGADGTTPLGNAGHGVQLEGPGAVDNTIGGTGPGAANVIAHNGGAGVLLYAGPSGAGGGNRILGNSIHDNAELGIDLGDDGPTPNDAGDGDGGPNDRQNYPTFAVALAAGSALEGTLASRPNRAYRLEFFANAACDPSGFGEGETFLGATDVTTDGAGAATFSVAFADTRNPAATATDLTTGDTSELSPCVPFGPRVTVINSVGDAPDLDTGDGACDTGDEILRAGVPEPECTLRAFLQQANASAGTDEGRFDVPADQYPPTGWPVIRPQSLLPAVTDTIVLDGATQPGAGRVEVSFGAGSVAAPRLGACPAVGSLGFELAAPNSVLAGFAINCYTTAIRVTTFGTVLDGLIVGSDFASTPGLGGAIGIELAQGEGADVHDTVVVDQSDAGISILGGSFNNRITNSFIGTDRSSAPALGNGVGIRIVDSLGNQVTDSVVSGNVSHGVLVRGDLAFDNLVARNAIGTDALGGTGLANGGDGVKFEDSCPDLGGNRIGGPPGSGNVISGNGGAGVHAVETENLDVQSNRIGTAADGAGALGNVGPGVWIEGSRDVAIGAIDPSDPECALGRGNVISANGGDGVLFSGIGATDNFVCDNLIGTDATGTAPLGNGGAGVRFDAAGVGSGNLVGDSVIAFNAADGIAVGDGFDVNGFERNRVFDNGGLGIDLEDDGVTPNDGGDGDIGANRLQNFPVIRSAYVSPGGVVTVRGTLESLLDEPFLVEVFSNLFCDASGHGEGEFHNAGAYVQTDLLGQATFTINFVAPVFDNLTTTASRIHDDFDEKAETSEFSACVDALAPPQASLVIDEVDAAAAGAELEFIELSLRPASSMPLAGKVLVLFDGATDASYAVFDLDGFSTGPDGFFVAGASGVAAADLTIPDGILQDGADAVALYDGDAADFPNGTPVTTDGLIDALVYGSGQGDDPGLLALLEPDQPQVDESAGGDLPGHSNQRCPDSAGGERFTDTYAQAAPTPGTENHCAVCTLAPASASGPVGGDRTVTALILVDNLAPAADTAVDFAVVTGPNAGTQGSADTNANGEARFTYNGAGGTGIDLVRASGVAAGRPFQCTASKAWIEGNLIFADGFESGDTSAWSATVP